MEAAAPNVNGEFALGSLGLCHTLPLILTQPLHVLTRKHEIIGSRLERRRYNSLPLPCLRVLSDMQTIRRCNRVSFAISGQVCWGASIASYVVHGGSKGYKMEALARFTWQYISKDSI